MRVRVPLCFVSRSLQTPSLESFVHVEAQCSLPSTQTSPGAPAGTWGVCTSSRVGLSSWTGRPSPRPGPLGQQLPVPGCGSSAWRVGGGPCSAPCRRAARRWSRPRSLCAAPGAGPPPSLPACCGALGPQTSTTGSTQSDGGLPLPPPPCRLALPPSSTSESWSRPGRNAAPPGV